MIHVYGVGVGSLPRSSMRFTESIAGLYRTVRRDVVWRKRFLQHSQHVNGRPPATPIVAIFTRLRFY